MPLKDLCFWWRAEIFCWYSRAFFEKLFIPIYVFGNKWPGLKSFEHPQILLQVMGASGLMLRGLNIDLKSYLLASGFEHLGFLLLECPDFHQCDCFSLWYIPPLGSCLHHRDNFWNASGHRRLWVISVCDTQQLRGPETSATWRSGSC